MEKECYDVLAVFKPKEPYTDFAVQELKSMLALHHIDVLSAFQPEFQAQNKELPSEYSQINTKSLQRPHFCRLRIPKSSIGVLQKIIERSVMTRTFLRLYADGDSVEDMHKNMKLDDFKEEMESEATYYFSVTAEFKTIL
jgi:hypothetical protein